MIDVTKLLDQSRRVLKKPAVILLIVGIVLVSLILIMVNSKYSARDLFPSPEAARKTGPGDHEKSYMKGNGAFNGVGSESQARIDEKTTCDDILRFYASKEAPRDTSGEYNTVAHQFFDITGTGGNHLLINTLIREAKTELEMNSRDYAYFLQKSYAGRQEEAGLAGSILTAIDHLFRSEISVLTHDEYKKLNTNGIEAYGYEIIADDTDNDRIMLKKTSPASADASSDAGAKTIQSNGLSATDNAVNYLAVGDAMQLPLSFVPGTTHPYVAWELSDGSHIYFDPEQGKRIDESEYLKTVMHDQLKEKGYFFSPLTAGETIGEAYAARGETRLESGDYIPAAADFCKAIQLNPKNINAYLMAVDSFEKANHAKEAKLIYDEAAKLEYGFLMSPKQ